MMTKIQATDKALVFKMNESQRKFEMERRLTLSSEFKVKVHPTQMSGMNFYDKVQGDVLFLVQNSKIFSSQ